MVPWDNGDVTAPELAAALNVKGGRLRAQLAKGSFPGAWQDVEGRWHVPARYMPVFEDVPLFEWGAPEE